MAQRRCRLARELMDEHEPEALVVFGNSAMHRHNNVNPVWPSQYLDAVARRLSELEVDRGRAGFVGVGHTSGMGMPWQHSPRLRELLPAIDPGRRGGAVRTAACARVRGGIERLRGAAELTDLAILGALTVVRGEGAESLRNVPFEPLIAG